jgi:hypothetical protein
MVSRPTTYALIDRRALGSGERRGAVLSGADLTDASWPADEEPAAEGWEVTPPRAGW